MRKIILMMGVLLFIGGSANAEIYVGGELYSENTLNIVDSSYEGFITVTGDSIVNIYYADYYNEIYDHYQPAFGVEIGARDTSIINFIYPDNYNFTIWYDGFGGSLPVYAGFQMNTIDYPTIADGFNVLRDYDPGIPHVLTPIAGTFELQDSAEVNFIPEPATVLLLGLGRLFLRRRS